MASATSSSSAATVLSSVATPVQSHDSSGIKTNNPGQILASTVDAEIARFRALQSELGQMRSDLQTVLGQRTENDLVLQELDLSSSSSSTATETAAVIIYKKVGPILIKQDLEEAKQTVRKRLEYINNERMRLESQIEAKENEAGKVAVSVQKIQAQLQQTTVEAVRAIRQNA